MAVKIKRQPDGYAPFFVDMVEGVAYITFQVEGSVVDIKWAKPPKGKAKYKSITVPDKEQTQRNQKEAKYE